MEFTEVIAQASQRPALQHEARRCRTRTSATLLDGRDVGADRRQHPAVALRRRALARGAGAARRGDAPAVGDGRPGRHRRLRRPSAVLGALRRPRRAALRDPGHGGRGREHPAGRRRQGSRLVLDRRVRRPTRSREALGVTPPDHARRDPARRLLGRVGGQAGAAAARRGHDVAVERPRSFALDLDALRELHRRLPPLRARRHAHAASSSAWATRTRTSCSSARRPGKKEDLQGEPFVGAAGKLLDELLAQHRARRARRSTSPTCSSAVRRATATRWPTEIDDVHAVPRASRSGSSTRR